MRTSTPEREDRSPAEDHQHDASDAASVAVGLHGVTKHYGRRRRRVIALAGVTAEFPRGSMSAVMGLSGSGKSTLLQVAAGLDKPTSGTVRLGDVALERLNRRTLSVLRRRRVGFVFQSWNLVPSLSVAENIALPLRLDHRRVNREEIAALAELVGLSSQLRRLPGTLSGGQQQRVAIARALANRPDVVFADEPTAALDPYTSESVVVLLRQATDQLGQTVVIVTHEPAVAAHADRALLLDRGRLVDLATAPSAGQLATALRRLGERGR